MSPLHLLGAYGKENSSQILDLFKENIRDYDLDQKDLKGNSGNIIIKKIKLKVLE